MARPRDRRRLGPGPYLRGARLRDGHGDEAFPFSLPAVRGIGALDLTAPVTFLVGDNGSGKSTLVEGLAVAAGFAPEGGPLGDELELPGPRPRRTDRLGDALDLELGAFRPRAGFFLRAKSFFDVTARVDAEQLEGIYGGTKLHEQSHGESFLALAANRFGGDGLYVLDEPEAALSVTSALGFIDVMHAAAAEGAQFVVATHSPILLACPGARIFEVSEAGVEPCPTSRSTPSASPGPSSRRRSASCAICCDSRMDFGLAIFPTDESIGPGDVARLAEERGFESLLFPEHTHIPVDHSPYPSGGELPRHYARTLDLFVAMTAAALATTRLRIGSGICLIIQRDPITTAKEVASIDLLSGGRVELGVGAGWNRPEIEAHGTDFGRRFGLMRERVEAMRVLWTEDEASYHGKHVDFGPTWSWPKPVQRPHPPVLVGGNGDRVLDRVLRYGDGWIPNREPGLAERIAELQSRAADAGRGHLPVTYFGVPGDPEAVERMEAAGVDRALFMLPSAGRERIEPRLDELTALVERHRGG
jgi:probable F420-dependent oxidoreductase